MLKKKHPQYRVKLCQTRPYTPKEPLEYNRALRNAKGAVYDIICGPFFICGLGEDDFASLPEDLMETYFMRFARPELFVRVGGNLVVMSI